ncbi:hypothetical protein [Pseudobutyrivibrio sp. MD2005]|uniref:hypothetical protein n=1 Tax=Pseudobutyrivibrio sp. MD2005 TaxID=1410616 RepID=UPI0004823544|nr:hypothetical protein [Pseudobutyrivibrio sp. MD2005]
MKLKGSYTVEAAIVISFCFILFGMAVILSYEVFKVVIEYVKYKEDSFDAVSLFRLKEGVMGVIHAITN